jgi:hypothetical protein
VTDTTGTTYIIYALSSITLQATSVSSTSGTIRASGAFTGVLRLVELAQSSHKALLDQYYQVYPISVGLDYSFTDTTGTLIFNWNTVGDSSKLLMLTWPHHRLTMQSPNFPATTALGYLTTKVHLFFFPSFLPCVLTPATTGMDVSCAWQPVAHALPAQLDLVEPTPRARLYVLIVCPSGPRVRSRST